MGFIYALVAIGFILIYNTIGALNFAQGDMTMIGAFFGVTFSSFLKLPLLTSYFLAILCMVLFGLFFQRVVYYPLRDKPLSTIILSTVGTGIALRNLAIIGWGPMSFSFPSPFKAEPFTVFGIVILPHMLLIISLSLALIVSLHLFLMNTSLGRKLRATSQDPNTAQLMGINLERMITLTFCLSCAFGGLAGLLLAPIFFVSSDLGGIVLIKAFIATVIGGFGNLIGAALGGVLLGVMEAFVAGYISSSYKDAIDFLVLIIILIVLPKGIFGEKIAERA